MNELMDVSGIEGKLMVILHQQREKVLYNLILERILFCRMDDVDDSHLNENKDQRRASVNVKMNLDVP
jgi:hypothetical protein